ncbi:MAG TPA: aldehyde dehydrogenase family protein [Polyangia bacterium]|jgi:acyl-CoA reductase-like NAD-dependent aldehyde dehydrogenase|nr:aldehyde dehydrogenase family protein [Polyangia bacterium]
METLRVTNPATGQLIREVPAGDAGAAAAAIARARSAQGAWGELPFSERARILRRLARAMRDDPTFLDTLCAESGKPRYEAENMELFYALELTRYYTGRAGRRALADELRYPLLFANKRARVVRHPRGVVAVIGPWNWPLLNNYADCIGPLIAGNAVVLKPSEHTPLTSLRVAELARDAGVPENVFQVVAGRGDVGAALTAAADMIFFTGSATTGKQVAQAAAARLVPAVLELGGKSPMIVLADADLPRAAHAAVWSGFAHSGQVCIRTERVIVEEAVADRFIELAAAEIGRLRQAPPPLGKPNASDVDVGAITFAPQIERAEQQIADAVARGGRVVTGGARRKDLEGQFFAPTLIADATPEMAVIREETFGPVLPVMRVPDADAALRAANDTPMGLSGSVWSGDAERASALARRLRAGSVCVNDALVNYFCFDAPLGGVKASGMGFRHGPEGLRQFCQIETIVEDHPLLGWLSPWIDRQLAFPYNTRTQRLLRWFMRVFY